MKRFFLAIAVSASATLLVVGPGAMAQSSNGGGLSNHPSSSYYRSKGRHHRHHRRRGGYSYSFSDTINTYGDARTAYGSTNSYRDPFLDRQSAAGPFDNGFFFDSAIAPHGGNSPYLN